CWRNTPKTNRCGRRAERQVSGCRLDGSGSPAYLPHMNKAGVARRNPAMENAIVTVPREILQLPDHFAIEPELREQLSGRPGHQRCVEGAGELLLVVHHVPRPGVPEREALFFWKRYDGCWTQAGGPGLDELGALLDRYTRVIDTY